MLAEGRTVGNCVLSRPLDTKRRDVWLARSSTGADVVVRALRATPELQALLSEAQTVRHPSVARVIAAGTSDDGPFAVAEKIEGLDLGRAVGIRPPILEQAAVWAVQRAARILIELRPRLAGSGPVHGAMSPAKLIVTPEGDVKLVDVLSRFAASPAVFAPELLAGGRPTNETDVFELSAILYELLEARAPFGENPTAGAFRSSPDRIERISEALWGVIERGLSIVAAERWPDLEALLTALDPFSIDDDAARAELSRWAHRQLPAATSVDAHHGPSKTGSFFEPERDVSADFGARFKVLSRLGEGGMGEVFRVEDRELEEVVALKIISKAASDPDLLSRLKREVRLARRISSPRVCRIHDLVELPDGGRGVTMAFLRGRTLHALAKSGELHVDYARFAKWGADVAEGLAAAHAIEVIHRDLKPENIMILEGDDHAVILDFGVAFSTNRDAESRLTEKGIILGTLPYMAPEQLIDDTLDGRADLYALGLVLAELITGEIPFSAKTYKEILERRVLKPERLDVRALDPTVPESFAAAISTLLAPNRAERPADATEAARLLRSVEQQLSSDAPAAEQPSAPSFLLALPSANEPVPAIVVDRVSSARRFLPFVLIGALGVGALLVFGGGSDVEKVAPRGPPDSGMAVLPRDPPDSGLGPADPLAPAASKGTDAGSPDARSARPKQPAKVIEPVQM
ncbi:MAG: protein kinase [Deltaproteobacteria bacterium]|nr:protein kinase [Deltaproteobacteria bacterium]